jgi:5-methylcytosine-specific restriction endonuclease McrA
VNRVFVLDSKKKPLMPCHPARARKLLRKGKAAVYRRVPFTIILKHRAGGATQPIALKLDPGSKTTGIALVAHKTLVFAANLHHRGSIIKQRLDRRRAIRRSRRARHTRYRPARFDNRRKPEGWLAPSPLSRVNNVVSWARRLIKLAPISTIEVETVRFDTQAMQRPGIAGIEYQQGDLAGYEVREYLLEKWNWTCAYCDRHNIPLEVEHVLARRRGGSNRISNLVMACVPCNRKKGDTPVETFLAKDPARLARINAQRTTSLRDAAATNTIRHAIGDALAGLGLPTTFWSGGRTKMNRSKQRYPKDHWIDAACVGPSGEAVRIALTTKRLAITAIGRGSRQMCTMSCYGFPRSAAKRVKRIHGFQTGDLARLRQPQGKHAGVHVGTIAVRTRGDFDLKTAHTVITSAAKNFTLLQRTNGYSFADLDAPNQPTTTTPVRCDARRSASRCIHTASLAPGVAAHPMRSVARQTAAPENS